MKLKAKRLTAQLAAQMWAEYCEAIGPEIMLNSYGWTQARTVQKDKHERVWVFYDPRSRARVGWVSMHLNTIESNDEDAHIALGVWPDQWRKGYRTAIFDWCAEKAEKLGAKQLSMIVLYSNEEHYQRTVAEVGEEGSPWIHAGEVWYPSGYGYFIRPLSVGK